MLLLNQKRVAKTAVVIKVKSPFVLEIHTEKLLKVVQKNVSRYARFATFMEFFMNTGIQDEIVFPTTGI